MKKIILPIILCLISIFASSQNVGINSTGSAPNASAILDVDATNKGFLAPRVNLMSTSDIVTIASPAVGLLVYNTNASITGYGADGVGYYYYIGFWAKLLINANYGPAWLTTGNTNTIDSLNFIGTVDFVPLNFKAFGNRAGRIDPTNRNSFFGAMAGGNKSALDNTAVGNEALRNNSAIGNYNTAVGSGALITNNSIKNTAVGYQSLYFNINGAYNTANGAEALYTNQNGLYNVAMGAFSLNKNRGSGNTGIGFSALYNNTTAEELTAIGSRALEFNTTGMYNTATGANALNKNTTGRGNTATGYYTLTNSTIGNENTSSGFNALYTNTTGSYNSAYGYESMYSNNTGAYNTAIGHQSLYNCRTDSNIAIGHRSLYSSTFIPFLPANANIAIGIATLYDNVNGRDNIAIGTNALHDNRDGNRNIGIGLNALKKNNNGIFNTANGVNALLNNFDGNYNTAIGNAALLSNTDGNNNTAIGNQALTDFNTTGTGNTAVGASALSTIFSGTGNTAVGYSATVQDGLTNATAIGAYAYTEIDNSIVLGGVNFYNGATVNTNVGIGNARPTAPLQLANTFENRKIVLADFGADNDHQFFGFGVDGDGVRYQTTNSSYNHVFYAGTSTATSTELMRINGNGNVGIGTSTPNAALQFGNLIANRRIVFYEAANNDHQFNGFGLNPGVLRFQVNNTGDDFVFYSGTSATTSNEIMRIKGNNNIGIGTATPSAKLEVSGSGTTEIKISSIGAFGPGRLTFISDKSLVNEWRPAYIESADNGGFTGRMDFYTNGTGAGNLFGSVRAMSISNSNVGIGVLAPTQRLQVAGNGLFTGTVTASCGVLVCSDIRYKKDIQPLQNTLSKVIQLQGVSYYFKKEEFKDKNFNDNKQVGLIAQEVEKIYPELVQTDNEGFKSIDYAKLTPILVEAIKELKQQNDVLKEDNIQLKTSVQKLDSSIQSIEKLLQTILPTYQASK
ncbi:MAG: tail fiber domain-containing protein [Chitinophagales bacterium]|jgi:hypothetical protein|nr:tail fiber domain-containing protein [Chitinophagales bacterium]